MDRGHKRKQFSCRTSDRPEGFFGIGAVSAEAVLPEHVHFGETTPACLALGGGCREHSRQGAASAVSAGLCRAYASVLSLSWRERELK